MILMVNYAANTFPHAILPVNELDSSVEVKGYRRQYTEMESTVKGRHYHERISYRRTPLLKSMPVFYTKCRIYYGPKNELGRELRRAAK
jgi:hypothetical protein